MLPPLLGLALAGNRARGTRHRVHTAEHRRKITVFALNHTDLGLCPTVHQLMEDVLPAADEQFGVPVKLIELMVELDRRTSTVEVQFEVPGGISLWERPTEAAEVAAAAIEG